MTMNRRNWIRGLYPTASEMNLNPFQLSISDEEAFGLSKFCRWVGTEIVNQPWTPEDAALMLRLETEPRIVCIPAVYGESNPVHVSHLLTSPAVVNQLLAVAANPDAPMFTGCRSFVMRHRNQLAAEEMIVEADKALYQGKAAGKNRVICYQPECLVEDYPEESII